MYYEILNLDVSNMLKLFLNFTDASYFNTLMKTLSIHISEKYLRKKI